MKKCRDASFALPSLLTFAILILESPRLKIYIMRTVSMYILVGTVHLKHTINFL